MDTKNLYEVVKKIIGPVNPIGETREDEARFLNLKLETELVNALLTDIDHVIPYKTREEYSMKKAGEFADKFFTEIGIVE